jgi:two-component system, chemotaxis family, chemotaxis protein CheY
MRIPSLLEKKLNLKSMKLLIVDGNEFSRSFTREVCLAFKFEKILTASTSTDALISLQSNEIDMVIMDWTLEPEPGSALVRHIRRTPGIRNPFVPVIVLSSTADKETIGEVRDAGANEFMARPFELRQLLGRFTQILLSPRAFIRCASYIGPDRRRQQREFDGEDRRIAGKKSEIRPPGVAAATQKAGSAGGITVKTMVEAGEKVIIAEEKRYTEVRDQDLAVLGTLFQKLCQATAPDKDTIGQIYYRAAGLKAMGQTFGFPLLTQAGDSLCRMLWKMPNEKTIAPMTIQGIDAHLKTMRLIVDQNIKHDGGKIGGDLIAGLRSLALKVVPNENFASEDLGDSTFA